MFYKKDVKVSMYRGTFRMIFTDDKEKIVRYFPDFFEGRNEIYAHGIWREKFTVVLNFWHKYKITHGTIAHEALHITDYIMESVDIAHDYNNPEPANYIIEWVTIHIYTFMEKHKLKASLKM